MTRTLLKENKHKYLHDALGYVLEDALIDEIIKVSQVKEVLADEVILNVGDSMQYIPIVLEGSIKISRENDEGDELLLYYIEGGDTFFEVPNESDWKEVERTHGSEGDITFSFITLERK